HVLRAIDEDRAVAFAEDEVEEDLALRRQQRRIERAARRQLLDIVGDEALQERARLRAGDGNDGTVVETGEHDSFVGILRAVAKMRREGLELGPCPTNSIFSSMAE